MPGALLYVEEIRISEAGAPPKTVITLPDFKHYLLHPPITKH
jgi:hypothetical protein